MEHAQDRTPLPPSPPESQGPTTPTTPLPEAHLGTVGWDGTLEALAERLWPGALALVWPGGAIVGGLGSGGRLTPTTNGRVEVICAGEEADIVAQRVAAIKA